MKLAPPGLSGEVNRKEKDKTMWTDEVKKWMETRRTDDTLMAIDDVLYAYEN